MFGMMFQFKYSDMNEVDKMYLLIEVMCRVYCDCVEYLGDFDFVKIFFNCIISEEYL